MSLLKRFDSPGSKRILALDGGGIRGALTLGYLQKIEDLLRAQHGNDNAFRLCDYFDLIGGTSTGSIIATCLALGWKVEEIKEKYFALGDEIFGDKHKWYEVFKFTKAKFDAKPLERSLRNVFKNISLGSDEIRTGLCIVIKRADTNSVWPLLNHPRGKFFDNENGTNKDILLWKAVRASAAAPTYFLPQIINVGGGAPVAAFVDGGVSMANNPALQLLMVASLKGFPFNWKLGAKNMLLVSVGTGMSSPNKLPQKITKNHLLNWAKEIPDMLMQDASWNNQIILQWISRSPTAWNIDSEIGNLDKDLLASDASGNGLISYLRFNLWLEQNSLKDLMGKDYTDKEVDELIEMSNPESKEELYKIGFRAAKNEIKQEHFPGNFKTK